MSSPVAGDPMNFPVLIVESDRWRRFGVERFLRENGITATTEERPERLIEHGRVAHRVSVVLLAAAIVESYGTSAVERVKKVTDAPLLLFGEPLDEVSIAALLTAGADGYYDAAGDPRGLIDAINMVSDGKMWAPRAAVALMARRAREGSNEERPGIADGMLLNLIAEGLSNKEIGQRLGLAEVTVKARLTRLYRRFGVGTRLQLLATLVRQRESDDGPRGAAKS